MANTIKIETIKKYVNELLATHGVSESIEYMTGVQDLTEWILIESGCYKGVDHLTTDEVPDGCKPGIREGNTLEDQFKDTDHNRVKFL
jgi:hypothetical protein